jgi:hypothetical protein
MNIHLIGGEFNSQDAIELIAQMVQVKVTYLENKIVGDSNEEDIKMREAKIKQFQLELYELRKAIKSNSDKVRVEAIIKIQ